MCTELEQVEELPLGHDAVIAGSPLDRWLRRTYTDKGNEWPPIIWVVDITRLTETELTTRFKKIGWDKKFVLVPLTNPHLRDYALNLVMRDHLMTVRRRGARVGKEAPVASGS